VSNKIKPLLAVFTQWPDLIQDKYNSFDVKFYLDPLDYLLNAVDHQDSPNRFEKYVAWVHDGKVHAEHDLCLFVRKPAQIELADFLPYLDHEHTTYKNSELSWILYQRGPVWQEKIILIEQSPRPVGVIFIDCWQQIQESRWPNSSAGFDFYRNTKQELEKYQIRSMVFHTGTYGGLPLAAQLLDWRAQNNSIEIQSIEHFSQCYKQLDLCNWIVVGAHWGRCTHDKPLGFRNLLQLMALDPNLHIYSHSTCTAKFINNDLEKPELDMCLRQDYEQDSLSWESNGKLYKLILP